MNKTFKLAIASVFSLCLTQSYAQTFGVKAGLNLSEFRTKNTLNIGDDYKRPNFGYHAGATAEFKTAEWLSAETGILFSLK